MFCILWINIALILVLLYSILDSDVHCNLVTMLIIRALIQLITPIGHWIPLNTAVTGLLLHVTVCAVLVPYSYTPLSVKKMATFAFKFVYSGTQIEMQM